MYSLISIQLINYIGSSFPIVCGHWPRIQGPIPVRKLGPECSLRTPAKTFREKETDKMAELLKSEQMQSVISSYKN